MREGRKEEEYIFKTFQMALDMVDTVDNLRGVVVITPHLDMICGLAVELSDDVNRSLQGILWRWRE